MTVSAAPRTHLYIPDTQIKPGVPMDHLGWIGEYALEKRPDVIVHAGDHADMPSCSVWDHGKIQMEGRRYKADIEAANAGFDMLCAPIEEHNERQRRTDHHARRYRPELHLTLGNHEDRIRRAVESDAKLEGIISVADLNYADHGFTVHPYLQPVEIDGVYYAHVFVHPMTGKPYGGTAINRLKTVGHSFTMGHQQTYDIAVRFVAGKKQRALIAGACYLHDEDYKGPQGNAHWRGIVLCHEVQDGSYDLTEVSLEYLCRRYEGVPLSQFTARRYGGFDMKETAA